MAGIYKGPVIENKLKAALLKSEKQLKRNRSKPRQYVAMTDAEIIEQEDKRIQARRERLGCGAKGGFRNGPGKALSVGVEVIYTNNAKMKRPRLANDVEQIRVLKDVYQGAEEKYKAGLKEKLKYSRVDLEGHNNKTRQQIKNFVNEFENDYAHILGDEYLVEQGLFTLLEVAN